MGSPVQARGDPAARDGVFDLLAGAAGDLRRIADAAEAQGASCPELASALLEAADQLARAGRAVEDLTADLVADATGRSLEPVKSRVPRQRGRHAGGQSRNRQGWLHAVVDGAKDKAPAALPGVAAIVAVARGWRHAAGVHTAAAAKALGVPKAVLVAFTAVSGTAAVAGVGVYALSPPSHHAASSPVQSSSASAAGVLPASGTPIGQPAGTRAPALAAARHGHRGKGQHSDAQASRPIVPYLPQVVPSPSVSPSPSGPVEGTLQVPVTNLVIADLPAPSEQIELDAAGGALAWGAVCTAPAGATAGCGDVRLSAYSGAVQDQSSEFLTLDFDGAAAATSGSLTFTFSSGATTIPVTVTWTPAPVAAASPSDSPSTPPPPSPPPTSGPGDLEPR